MAADFMDGLSSPEGAPTPPWLRPAAAIGSSSCRFESDSSRESRLAVLIKSFMLPSRRQLTSSKPDPNTGSKYGGDSTAKR